MKTILKKMYIDTPLGCMLALASDKELYLLEFADRLNLAQRITRLYSARFDIIEGLNKPLELIAKELKAYFDGTLKSFSTPRMVHGTPFQKQVWHALGRIEYGDTVSYADIASKIDKEKAYRAVAMANHANRFTIIIPCHRVIGKDGMLTGYNGGLNRKEWLLNHEKTCSR